MNETNCMLASEIVHRMEDFRFKKPISWRVNRGEQWAIIGANGAGKTLLIDTLVGKFALKSGGIHCFGSNGETIKTSEYIKIVAFRDIYSLADTRDSFYQQRWNVGVMQNDTPTKDIIPKDADPEWTAHLVQQFGISDLLEKDIRLLSSGELRKFLIVKSLLNRPKILILDNPYIGLDVTSRQVLNDLFDEIAKKGEVQIVLVLSNPRDIPDMITHILPIKEKNIEKVMTRQEFMLDTNFINSLFPTSGSQNITFPKYEMDKTEAETIVHLKNIHVQYGKRIILDKLDWKIRKGEKWALIGPNGAGKSTLLSLISGDNPQAYANDICLFGNKRGSGESIWDIKKHIGYISPEMHLHYLKNIPCLDIVGSGFFDTIGLYLKCNDEQKKIALEWMELFGIAHLQNVSFLQVSSGEQRMLLLARIFVKNPNLLILDEPLHGLDVSNKEKVKNIIECFCNSEKTVIFVSHYDEDIPKVVDKRFVLSKR